MVYAEKYLMAVKTEVRYKLNIFMKRTSTLPALSVFEDKRITSGLRYIIGGAVTRTGPGRIGDEDYCADASNGTATIFGLCKNHKTADAFFVSAEFNDFINKFG